MTATTPAEPTTHTLAEGGKRMFIRIRELAYVYADSNSFRQWCKDNVGQWLEVDTEHLFNNQYNTTATVGNDGSMHVGWRLLDAHIDAVRNDARVGMGKCKYCGKMVSQGQGCSKDVECITHGIEWFTEKNTYFLKYPTPPDIQIEKQEPIKIGSYTLEWMSDGFGIFRLRNCRKRIDFKYINGEYWVFNGIGYTKRKYLDIPDSLTIKIKTALNKFIKQ